MERTSNQGGELQATHLHLVPLYEEQYQPYQDEDRHEQHQESHNEQVIREGIERALHDSAEIDDRMARYIASQPHEG